MSTTDKAALLVGGALDGARDRTIEAMLAEYGIRVQNRWRWVSAAAKTAPTVDVVLVDYEFCAHNMHVAAVQVAARLRVPLIRFPSTRKAAARMELEKAGYVRRSEPPACE